MSLLSGFYSLLKLFAILTTLLAVAIPFYYESTDLGCLRVRVLHSIISSKYSMHPDASRPNLSPDYVAFETLLKNRPIVKFDSTHNIHDVVQEMRSSFPFGKILPRSSQCKSKELSVTINDHSLRYYQVHYAAVHETLETDRVLIYFHGGGYMVGDFQNYAGFECHLSSVLNLTVVHFEYDRTPENSIPSIAENAVTFYRHILDRGISSSRILIMGDSAGGGLTFLTIQSIINQNLPKPRAAITLSPWTDLMLTGESLKRNREVDVMLHAEQVLWMVEHVIRVDKNDAHLHSPLLGSLKGFPPLYVCFGTAEILEDDSKRIIEKAIDEGVDVTVEEGKHMMHVYPLFYYYFPEARQSLHRIQQWVDNQFN